MMIGTIGRQSAAVTRRHALNSHRASTLVSSSSLNIVTHENASRASILTDRFGRSHTYLRISLTERCNLRCE